MAHGKVIEVDKYAPLPQYKATQTERKEKPDTNAMILQPRHLQSPDILGPRRRRLLRHLVRTLQGRCSRCRQAQRDLQRCALHPGRCG